MRMLTDIVLFIIFSPALLMLAIFVLGLIVVIEIMSLTNRLARFLD